MAKDFSKLIGRIIEKYGTRSAFCREIGKNPEWLSRRLNSQTEFSSDEIISMTNKLEIAPQDISLYFFTLKVR